MVDLLPTSPDTSAAEEVEPRVIGVDSEAADEIIAAISSTTARRLLTALHDEPAAPSELASTVDTSIQNVQYHLGKLEAAALIEVIDTCYSEKGRKMQVYAPTDRPLVVFAGRETETTGLKAALTRLLGAFGVLALASLVVQRFFGAGDGVLSQQGASSGAGGGGGAAQTTTAAAETAAEAGAAGLQPGFVFFAGGAAVLLVGFAVWYVWTH
jgi:DNA-binding transcriptional ArsR family regulator